MNPALFFFQPRSLFQHNGFQTGNNAKNLSTRPAAKGLKYRVTLVFESHRDFVLMGKYHLV